MEINITDKYAKDFLEGKVKKYLKITDEGTFFTGSIKFKLLNSDNFTKQMEISLWVPGAKEPIFIVRETFSINDDAVFTFEPVMLQMGIS